MFNLSFLLARPQRLVLAPRAGTLLPFRMAMDRKGVPLTAKNADISKGLASNECNSRGPSRKVDARDMQVRNVHKSEKPRRNNDLAPVRSGHPGTGRSGMGPERSAKSVLSDRHAGRLQLPPDRRRDQPLGQRHRQLVTIRDSRASTCA
jgi:hypothetical protein